MQTDRVITRKLPLVSSSSLMGGQQCSRCSPDYTPGLMTAQVVILNKLAVTAASDSSVTLTTPDGRQRPFPSAEKIYPLPPPHAVAVLHSGNTQLLDVPYVVLVGEWFRTLPATRMGRVQDYSDLFTSWISDQHKLFTQKSQDDHLAWMLRDYFLAIKTDLSERWKQEDVADKDSASLSAEGTIQEVLSERLRRLRQQPSIPGWESFDKGAYIASRMSVLDKARDWVFDGTPRTPAGDAMLTEVAAELLRVQEPWNTDAELVFAGFGEDELFPAQQSITFQGILDNRLRTVADDYVSVGSDGPFISPFAQTEAVDTFLRAYHRSYLGVAHRSLDSALNDLRSRMNPGEISDADLDEVTAAGHRSIDDDWERVCREEFVGPMIDTVGGLPPAEIARLAEALVGLQVLRQLTQAETETVGGPIDVALITREQGFRWLRHKTLGSANTIA